MEVQQLTREFTFNGIKLADPGAALSVDQVKDFYASVYPDITNAEIEGPEVQGDKHVYTFRRAVGTKGGLMDKRAMLDAIDRMASAGSNERRLQKEDLNTPGARALAHVMRAPRFGDADRLSAPAGAVGLLP